MANEIQSTSPSWFGSIWSKLRCLRGIHAPDRRRVRKSGMHYIAKCQTCGKPIRKLNGRAWKPYKP